MKEYDKYIAGICVRLKFFYGQQHIHIFLYKVSIRYCFFLIFVLTFSPEIIHLWYICLSRKMIGTIFIGFSVRHKTASDCEASVLKSRWMCSSLSLLLLPGPLWGEIMVPFMFIFMDQIKLWKLFVLETIKWNAVSSKQRSCRYCNRNELHGR